MENCSFKLCDFLQNIPPYRLERIYCQSDFGAKKDERGEGGGLSFWQEIVHLTQHYYGSTVDD